MNSKQTFNEVNEAEGSDTVDEPTSRKRIKLECSHRSISQTELGTSQDEEVVNDRSEPILSDTDSIDSFEDGEEANDSDVLSQPMTEPSNIHETASTELKIPSFICLDESSEEDFPNCNVQVLGISKDNADKGMLGDTSEEVSTSPTSNSDVDPGLPRNDYLDFEKCLLCNSQEKDVSFPYCVRCYSWKKKLFPDRPKKKKKLLCSDNEELEPMSESSSSGLLSCDNDNIFKKQNTSNSLSDTVLDNKNRTSDASDYQDCEEVVACAQPSTSSSVKLGECNTCRICFSRTESGLFVHANSAHLYGCYKCAKTIWFSMGACPICRRKVYKVTKFSP